MKSLTMPGQIILTNGQLDSIKIPADPEQKEFELQFQISSEATAAVIPKNGVQAFGASPHMHKRGVRSRFQQIRNGTHIQDVSNTLSYDFNMQSPSWKRWHLMPGDSLILTCTYLPLADGDVVGGFSADNEMCIAGFGIAPAIPEFPSIVGVGYAVRPSESFKNSFLGPIEGQTSYLLDYSNAKYKPNKEGRNFIPLKDHEKQFCELFVRDELQLFPISFASIDYTAQFTMISAFFFCALMRTKSVSKKINGIESERTKCNTIIYLGQLLFSAIALPFAIVALTELFPSTTTFDAVNSRSYSFVRGLITIQSVLFLLELFYRIAIRTEVVVHHLLTTCLVLFLYTAMQHTFALKTMMKIGLSLFLMALIDQPVNLTLLLKNLNFSCRAWWPKLCKCSAVTYVVCKMWSVALVVVVMIKSSNGADKSFLIKSSFSDWMEESTGINQTAVFVVLSITSLLLLADQVM